MISREDDEEYISTGIESYDLMFRASKNKKLSELATAMAFDLSEPVRFPQARPAKKKPVQPVVDEGPTPTPLCRRPRVFE